MLMCPRWSCRPSSFTAPVDCPRGTLDSLCRRAAHPGNLRGKLVSSAALLIRLLPLVQLLLMRFLYFVVRAIATACAGKGCFASQLACPCGRLALRGPMLPCSLPGFLPSYTHLCCLCCVHALPLTRFSPAAGRGRHGTRVLDRPGALAAVCYRAAAYATGPGATAPQVQGVVGHTTGLLVRCQTLPFALQQKARISPGRTCCQACWSSSAVCFACPCAAL